MTPDQEGRLSGRSIAVTADRRGEDQVIMFERLGARVLHGPTISTHKVPDPDLLRARTEEIIARPPDFLIANTGIGIRTWMECVTGWDLADALRDSLGEARIAARGPKAAGALTSAGLDMWWRSPSEQLGELCEHLVSEGLEGRRVVLQLHGDDGTEFVSRLTQAGATVSTLPVYVWGPPADDRPARRVIDECCAGAVDAITFTAGPQIGSLMEIARTAGREPELLAALNGGVVVGCIGPVCAAVAQAAGIERMLVPAAWRLGSLVRDVADTLTQRR